MPMHQQVKSESYHPIGLVNRSNIVLILGKVLAKVDSKKAKRKGKKGRSGDISDEDYDLGPGN